MDILRQHEIFEIEVIDRMKRAGLLEPLVFGGGTMLRLCHELNRYSVDLDFWFLKKVNEKDYYAKAVNIFDTHYDITDAKEKHFTLLLEIRSPDYPKRLKIEIRKGIEAWDFHETIAFSRFGVKQVALKAHTLDQSMKNKLQAFLNRNEIRDCFDIEFLLRRGVELPPDIHEMTDGLLRKIDGFKDGDFKVKLGSILEEEYREYYITRRFSYLKEKITSALSNSNTG
ncbi:MAG: nucleotidyl transferase AbiEii/AbiGii toxin family protein [Desulfobacteraceae bacterium]|nr:nucleotidyl transferase AbiEii/AbiGii toxin family protein [Desulfobacteraceae bacterium]